MLLINKYKSGLNLLRRNKRSINIQKRNFFGIGELIGILANPRETINSLAQSKRLLEETRASIIEKKERESIPPKHTFSPPPGLQYREKEIKILKTCLSSIPNFTVIFGGSSVGKTALLRQVLTDERYHVIHFDLRMAGFADVSSLFFSFSYQMEQYFVDLASRLEGYESFVKEALAFKHLRLDVERRIEKNGPPIKTSDIAHLLEIFQSCLLKYWEFNPINPEELETEKESITNKPIKDMKKKNLNYNKKEKENKINYLNLNNKEEEEEKKLNDMEPSRAVELEEVYHDTKKTKDENFQQNKNQNKWKPPVKLIPVFFIDEAHKLPILIKDPEAMKCILDGLLVLTKQDRLCHVINATSDPFYMYWLRNMNVLTHCTIITIADTSKKEAKEYFKNHLLTQLKKKKNQQLINSNNNNFKSNNNDDNNNFKLDLNFDSIYEIFGGKLTHLHGFVTDFLNSDGKLKPKKSSAFLQAYALLQHHLINNQQQEQKQEQKGNYKLNQDFSRRNSNREKSKKLSSSSNYNYLFEKENQIKILTQGQDEYIACFTTNELLYVISKFTDFHLNLLNDEIILDPSSSPSSSSSSSSPSFSSSSSSLSLSKIKKIEKNKKKFKTFSYFKLCKEISTKSINDMIKFKILDLRWTIPVSSSDDDDDINDNDNDEEKDYNDENDDLEFLDPVVLPVSPVMKSAMQFVLFQQFNQKKSK